MTIVRSLDTNHDWEFGKGQNDYKRNKAAVVQDIDTRLNCFLGDCFFDTSAGVDWFNFLGGKDQISLNLAVSAVILNTPDVVSLIQLSINLNHTTRKITMSYQVMTSFGLAVNTVPIVTSYLTTEGGDILTTEGGDKIVV